MNNEQASRSDILGLDRRIILTRDDLMDRKKNTPIEDITIYDFNTASVPLGLMLRANHIVFRDAGVSKTLKDRHPQRV